LTFTAVAALRARCALTDCAMMKNPPICPTCQSICQARPCRRPLLFCMGCFRYLGPAQTMVRRILCRAPPVASDSLTKAGMPEPSFARDLNIENNPCKVAGGRRQGRALGKYLTRRANRRHSFIIAQSVKRTPGRAMAATAVNVKQYCLPAEPGSPGYAR